MKQLVYQDKINTGAQLLKRIQTVSTDIRNEPDLFDWVKNSLVRRCEAWIEVEE